MREIKELLVSKINELIDNGTVDLLRRISGYLHKGESGRTRL